MTAPARSRLFAAALAVLGLASLGAVAPALPASAHDQLIAASPEDGATVTDLTEIELVFSATLLSIGEDQRSSAIQVVHDGRYYETACPALVDDTATVAVEPGSPGLYEVRWQVVSSDGHTISDAYTFDYEPADGTSAAGGADTPACGEADGGEPPADQPSDDSILIGAAAGIGGLAAIGVVIAILLGRRRALPGEEDGPGQQGGDGARGGRDD